jgi:SAM-dependent methyltransferase
MDTDLRAKRTIRNIIAAYETPRVRLYGRVRCGILNHRFLDEIAQYLPRSGLVLDIGCGFGLIAHYYASLLPNLRIHGVDINPRRIAMAANATRRLQLPNVEFSVGDARQFSYAGRLQGAYMMDLVHHMPQDAVGQLVKVIASRLRPGCRFVIKDVDTRPWYKLVYTWMLDKFMDYRAPLRYWSSSEMWELFESSGFRVYKHSTLGYLPSPHVVYIATKRKGEGPA